MGCCFSKKKKRNSTKKTIRKKWKLNWNVFLLEESSRAFNFINSKSRSSLILLYPFPKGERYYLLIASWQSTAVRTGFTRCFSVSCVFAFWDTREKLLSFVMFVLHTTRPNLSTDLVNISGLLKASVLNIEASCKCCLAKWFYIGWEMLLVQEAHGCWKRNSVTCRLSVSAADVKQYVQAELSKDTGH